MSKWIDIEQANKKSVRPVYILRLNNETALAFWREDLKCWAANKHGRADKLYHDVAYFCPEPESPWDK